MKLVQIITIVFCLGIFMIPKDNFYAQNMQEKCCKEGSAKSCCEKQKPENSKDNHGNKQKSSSCNDDCCSYCAACYSFIETPFSRSLKLDISYYKSNKNLNFQYSDPYISGRLREIWQPPKLG
ncbi:hypothetical protein EG349_11035 [Chryseobacterium shandongense]|uniref:Uncharacterized protein n=1 Tax=Chryseobacterium shandongense TaxID=1493872 RepID=A0A3G6QDJ9_9FLAO|nr:MULTISPECIES: hypothetical protein [Chryseobacterium]AZA59142.1 hypothetical protein EG350_18960 [Chryseobacterium shandongense]AZA87289.1 hypothetical protein EG349_11035 [Chryseobacterium shandongense]AZA95789.1 hypothetical protein EG353_09490 [Chryseobacterium shandongense]